MRVVAFVLVGAALGAMFRAWMRFISTDPEFSWSGTGYIIGVFAVLGLMAGLVDVARRRDWVRRLVGVRVVGSVLALGLFMAAGSLTFATIVPGALAVARTDWHKLIRIGLVVLAVAAAGAVVLGLDDLSLAHRAAALTMYLGLCAVEVLLLSRILAPSLPVGSVHDAPLGVRFVLVGLPLLVVFALVMATVGIGVD